MIKIEDVEVMGMRKAIKGMRNAMNSWDKSDSGFYQCGCPEVGTTYCGNYGDRCFRGNCGTCPMRMYDMGDADMDLAKRLIKAVSPDRKFLRMIHVQADVTAPLYWWKEYDTYKVGTVANSCSTMHTIHKRDLTLDDFSYEHLIPVALDCLNETIKTINTARQFVVDMKLKEDWWQMIQLLPSSFNQMRTIDLNYETLLSIYRQRKSHKLDEWRDFCKWIETLPYMKEFLGLDEQVKKEKRELS